MIQVGGPHRPIIWNREDGRFAGSGGEWVLIGPGVALNDLEWTGEVFKPTTTEIRKTIQGNNGIYEVRRTSAGYWSCQCLGFLYRQKCRHIEEVKANVLPE